MNYSYSKNEKVTESKKPANCFVIPKGESGFRISQNHINLINRLSKNESICGFGWDDDDSAQDKDSGYLFAVHFGFNGKVSYELVEEDPKTVDMNQCFTILYDNFEEK